MKSKQELYAQLVADFEARSGQAVADSSEIAVRLWATAAALESLYYYTDWSRQQAFVQTASGEYLDYHGQSRGLARIAPTASHGTLRFYRSAGTSLRTVIAAGTVVAANEQLQFETTAICTIERGDDYADVAAVCQTLGAVGNVPANTIRVLTDAPVGVDRCTNPAPFSGGADNETDEAFRARILQSYHQLSTGANSAYYYSTVMQSPNVRACKVLPRVNGVGTVKILVVDAYEDAVERAALVQRLNNEREISTTVSIEPAEVVSRLLTYYIWRKPNVGFDEACQIAREAVMAYMETVEIGQTVYLSQITARIIGTGLFKDCKPVEGAGDLLVGTDQYAALRLEFMEGN